MKRLSTTHIETLCCIARLGTFTAAAEKLCTSQSAISARIRELESTLGATLFQRRGRRVELTMFGREFYERAQPMLYQMEELLVSADRMHAAGRVRIGVGIIPMTWLAHLFRRLGDAMPGLIYDIEVGLTAPLLAALEQGKLDLAVIPAAIEHKELVVESVGLEQMSWVISRDLLEKVPTRRARADIQALLDQHPLWCVPRPSYYFNVALAGLRHPGVTPRRVHTCNNMGAAHELALAGAGIALLGTELARPSLASGALVPAFGSLRPPPVQYFIACHRDRRHTLLRQVIEQVLATRETTRAPATPRRRAAQA